MKKSPLLLSSLLLLAAAFPLRAADPKAVQAAIVAQEKKYDEAFNKGDAAALASLYLEDAQILPPDTDVVKGRPAIEQFWKAEIKSEGSDRTKSVSTPVEIQDHGGVAHETGTFVNTKPDGSIAEQGKYFVLWKKQSGQWKIYRETWNRKPSATKP